MNIMYQYAVKVVCGKSDGEVMAPGEYWTAINVHNPAYRTVRFRKKVAVALPGEKPGPVSKFYRAKLGPDEAFEIDRDDILRHAGQSGGFLKGFVVIESPRELDVVAVYSAAGRDRLVETVHSERVPARRVEVGLPDLVPVPNDKGLYARVEDRALIVTVQNQGTADAGPSDTEVDFYNYGKQIQPTKALAVGEKVELAFPLPRYCFDSDCEFKITVDVNNAVTESNEGNNVAYGNIVG